MLSPNATLAFLCTVSAISAPGEENFFVLRRFQQSQQNSSRRAAMSSFGSRWGHLDATSDREVVFCDACQEELYRFACQEEWYPTLLCPNCGNVITEIVSHQLLSWTLPSLSRATPTDQIPG